MSTLNDNIHIYGKKIKYHDISLDMSFAVYVLHEKNTAIIYYGTESSIIDLKHKDDYKYFEETFFNS